MRERLSTYSRAKQAIGSAPTPTQQDLSNPTLKNLFTQRYDRWVAKHKSFATTERDYLRRAGVPNFRRGGKVKNTGLALVHKGEFVVTKAQHKQIKKILKTKGRV